MKIFLKIVFILMGFSGLIFPQFYTEKEISPSVLEFMKIVEETAQFYDDKQGLLKSFSDEELNHITKLYFKVYDEDPVGLSKYIGIKKKEWDKEMKESNGTFKELKPAGKKNILKQQIRKKYGGKFTEIISTPAFIRGKVISIGRQDSQFDLTVYVEEVLKGEKFFTKGTTITISYSMDWGLGNDYQVNKSYLFPLRPWLSLREYKGEITLQWLFYKGENRIPFEGKIEEVYPIENESVYSKEDFFDTGIWTPWETFKEHFNSTYMIWGK